MTKSSSTSQGLSQQPGPFRRFLGWLVKFIIFLVIIGVLAVVFYYGYQELQKSFLNVHGRVDQQNVEIEQIKQRLDDQQKQLDEQKAQQQTIQQLNSDQNENLSASQKLFQDNFTAQGKLLDAIDLQIAALLTASESMTQTVTILQAGQLALQQDLIGTSGELDILGGEFDGLKSDLDALNASNTTLAETVTAFETELSDADLNGLRQAFYLMRIWEMISRARIRLAENNPGLAKTDVETAQAALTIFIEKSPEQYVEPLLSIERRLLLASQNLPDTPDLAVGDLDLAWQALDEILVEILNLQPVPTE